MPRRIALFVYLRRRTGALVFAAARLSGNTAGELHGGNAPPRISDAQGMCATVHGKLRAASRNPGQLALAANSAAHGNGGRGKERSGADRSLPLPPLPWAAEFAASASCPGLLLAEIGRAHV